MTVSEWLQKAQGTLSSSGISTAALDCEVLLSDYVQKDRYWLHAHPDSVISEDGLAVLNHQVQQRKNHVPLAYIRGKQEFYGKTFMVSPQTLTPRPETETLIELALSDIAQMPKEKVSIADIGTGSGCIALTLALEIGEKIANCTGYDISKEALMIARKNAVALDANNVSFTEMDLLTVPNLPSADIITANLPYVPDTYGINLAASHEPRIAIFGGSDGLDYYRSLFAKLSSLTTTVFTESLPPQQEELARIALDANFSEVMSQDFIQVFKRNKN